MTAFEDQLAIRALLERYCDGVNQRDADIWGSTWAEDAVWELPHLDMEGITGRDNIIAAWLQAMELFPFVNMMAHPGYIRDWGRATMRSYTSEVAVMQDGTQIEPGVSMKTSVCVWTGSGDFPCAVFGFCTESSHRAVDSQRRI